MGCFLACFGSSKTRRKKPKKYTIAEPVLALVNNRASLCSKDVYDPEDLSTNQERKVVFDNKTASKLSYAEFKSEQPVSAAQTVSIASSLGSSYPPNHRYVNCLDDDYEVEDLNYRNSCRDKEDDVLKEECETVESKRGISAVESIDKETESSSMAIGSNRRDYVQPVWNPEEEVSEIKPAEAEETPPLLNLEKEDCKMDKNPARKYDRMEVDASLSNWLASSEITAEKSNSVRNWEEERPILGALTLDELKKLSASSTPRKSPSRSPEEIPIIGTVGTYWNLSASSTPRKSPSRSPEEIPIIGTVGTYWNLTDSLMESGSPSSFKGIPNTTSKYREDKRVNWHSTPFETRLERALNRGAV